MESHRLVTLAGAGGAGKTRLALEVAAQLLDANREGVFFVDLAGVGSAGEVPATIHSALGAHARAGASDLDALVELLERQQTLIVLDNCEHVIDECARIAEHIEQRSRAVHILATSREPFGIDGERVYRLGPLSLPPADASSLADLEASEAVELFVERVRGYDAAFVPDDATAPILASICRRLDGVPFALELAAARMRSMSLADLHRRLDQRFGLLTSGSRTALPRQRTLQATVDWSYDLLQPEERSVLDRLSVFVGDFDLAAAEAVCGPFVPGAVATADALASLVDKSLVACERAAGELRFLLLETIRQYAADKLGAGGAAVVDETRRAYADHFLALAEQARSALRGGSDQGRWMRRMDQEWPNLRAAADHFDGCGDARSVLRLCAALYRWCGSRGNKELWGHLERALAAAAELPPGEVARGFLAGSSMWATGAPSDAELAQTAELADAGIAVVDAHDDPVVWAELLVVRAAVAWVRGEPDWQARADAATAAALASADDDIIGLALMNDLPRDEPGEARAPRAADALAHLREAGDQQAIAYVFSWLGHERLVAGDAPGALELAREAVRITEEIGGRVDLHGNLAVCALLNGALDEAERAARTSLVASARRTSGNSSVDFPLWVIACCATRRGEAERAARLLGAHDALDAHVAEVASHSFTWTPLERQARDENRRQLRAALGDEELERARREGEALPLDAVIDLALGRTSLP